MRKRGYYQYYVEGDDEKSLVDSLKCELGCIESGKVEKFNPIQNLFTTTRIRTLKQGTTVVLVYDTDVDTNLNILRQNIVFLEKQGSIKEVLCVPQVKNMEDELEYSCQIKKVEELTGSPTRKDFKRDFNKCTNRGARLMKHNFDITKLWSRLPENEFREFGNNADKIKIKKS